MLYMVTFTINIPPMLAYIPYMDPMGIDNISYVIDISRFPTVPLFDRVLLFSLRFQFNGQDVKLASFELLTAPFV